MKTIKMKQFDNKDKEIADILFSLGISRNAATILTYLQNVKSATSADLEREANMRQPEVSITMKQLMERDWIDEKEEKKPGKGRPYKIYSLKVVFKDIIAQLEIQQRKAIDKTQARIEMLKEIGG